MAYVIPRAAGRWELRESRLTHRGPRSRTLASFRSLSAEVIERARSRASKPLEPQEIRAAALRAGAPVDLPPADQAAADLLRQIDRNRGPRRGLHRLLVDALAEQPDKELHNARSGAAWLAATPAQRGETLTDLLLLADALPQRRRPEHLSFPRLGGAR